MSEYTKQANDFLEKHNIKFLAKHKADKCPLWCDNNCIHGERYLITFSRKIDLCNALNLSGKPMPKTTTKRFSLSFWNSMNDMQNGKAPTAYCVLSALQKYDIGDFEDFCSGFGYDTDSRKAYTSYKGVVKEFEKVEKFFTSEEIEELQEIS